MAQDDENWDNAAASTPKIWCPRLDRLACPAAGRTWVFMGFSNCRTLRRLGLIPG